MWMSSPPTRSPSPLSLRCSACPSPHLTHLGCLCVRMESVSYNSFFCAFVCVCVSHLVKARLCVCVSVCLCACASWCACACVCVRTGVLCVCACPSLCVVGGDGERVEEVVACLCGPSDLVCDDKLPPPTQPVISLLVLFPVTEVVCVSFPAVPLMCGVFPQRHSPHAHTWRNTGSDMENSHEHKCTHP